ncbi:MAG: 4Fe-4S binding protein [Succinivibrio sp.]
MFVINKDLCTGCHECLTDCPNAAIELNAFEEVEINVSVCSDCGICQSVCPFDAIEEKKDD